MRVHFQQNFKILSRARSVHLWPCLGEEKERQRKIHMHAITLYSVISFNYATIYIYIYIYTRLQKGCLQTDRYVEWVISIKYVKKRMQKYTALLYVMHISPWGMLCPWGGGVTYIFLNILITRLVNKSRLRINVPFPKHISTYFFLTRVRKQC